MARLAGLLLGAVLGIHELRYLLAFGDQTASALEHTGHDYLAMAVPFCGLVLAVGLSGCLPASFRDAWFAELQARRVERFR